MTSEESSASPPVSPRRTPTSPLAHTVEVLSAARPRAASGAAGNRPSEQRVRTDARRARHSGDLRRLALLNTGDPFALSAPRPAAVPAAPSSAESQQSQQLQQQQQKPSPELPPLPPPLAVVTLRHARQATTTCAEADDAARTLRAIADDFDAAPSVSAAAAAHSPAAAAATTTPLSELRKLPTEANAEEAKRALAGYYGALSKRVLAHVFAFDVFVPASRERDKSRRRALQVDLAAGTISRFTKLRHKRKEVWGFAGLLNAVRDDFDPEVAYLRMRDDDSHEVALRFAGQVERERFYQLCWLGQCNALAAGGSAPIPTSEPISVFVGTFNMADRAPRQPPELWLRHGAYDVCAVCAQECTSEALFQRLTGHLGNGGSGDIGQPAYMLLEYVSIYYVKLAVYVHRRHIAKVRNVERSTQSTGLLGGVVGNKGAVAIAFQLAETSFCFVGVHLEAGESERSLETRNTQFSSIVRGLRLGAPRCDVLNQFDHVIWCGDFNYRISGIPHAEAVAHIKQRNLAPLLQRDQLHAARAAGDVFIDHNEGPITFPPTYKLVQAEGGGQRVYDKHRVPAWCDRVLWKSLPNASPLRQVEYGCSDILTSSDHRPVFSIFQTSILLPGDPTRTTPLSISFRGPTVAQDLLLRDQLHCDEEDEGSIAPAPAPRPGGAAAAAAAVAPPSATSVIPNPVLLFKAPFLDPRKTFHSRIKRGTTSPTWAEGEIRDVPTCVCDPAFLAQQHLTVLVLHLESNTQDVLGQCAIPLGPLSPSGVHFEVRFTHNGKAAGTLSGTVCLVPSRH